MKLKQIESALSVVEPFSAPKIELEQYPTSAHLASRVLYAANATYDDIEGKSVLDLGTGTAMLGLAAEILGSCNTLGVDIDQDAITLAQTNNENLEAAMDFMFADILNENGLPIKEGSFDTVVMNPPFGTRNKGADVKFLQAGLYATRSAVYSMHKSTTRDFLQRKATKEWGVTFEVLAQLKFDIPKMYKFHKKDTADIYVDLIRLCKRDTENQE